ncbi:hypothetical protein J2Y58_003685 [Sphingomonas sp. BE138]|nr:hypothetical protein [Sphingomonas sp. BE138]
MSELWSEHAVATVVGPDGYRMIVGEGSLDSVLDAIVERRTSSRDVRVSLPNRRHAPTSFCEANLAELLRQRRILKG